MTPGNADEKKESRSFTVSRNGGGVEPVGDSVSRNVLMGRDDLLPGKCTEWRSSVWRVQ